MAFTSVGAIGIGRVIANFKQIAKNIEKDDDSIKKAAQIFEREAKRLSPVDTGFLRTNIKSSSKGDKVISNAAYSAAQEYGTSKMSAANKGKGYMRPAAKKTKTKMLKVYGKSLWENAGEGV